MDEQSGESKKEKVKLWMKEQVSKNRGTGARMRLMKRQRELIPDTR